MLRDIFSWHCRFKWYRPGAMHGSGVKKDYCTVRNPRCLAASSQIIIFVRRCQREERGGVGGALYYCISTRLYLPKGQFFGTRPFWGPDHLAWPDRKPSPGSPPPPSQVVCKVLREKRLTPFRPPPQANTAVILSTCDWSAVKSATFDWLVHRHPVILHSYKR